MDNENILFNTGTLMITDNAVTFQSKSGSSVLDSNSILRENIGSVDTQDIKVLPHVDIVYAFRIAIVGVLLLGGGLILALHYDFNLIAVVGIVCIVLAAILWFFAIWGLLIFGRNITAGFLLYFFGVDCTRVTVKSIYGNSDLNFLVDITEKSKIPNLMVYKLEKNNVMMSNRTVSGIDDLEKLLEYYNKNLITKKEYDLKRKQILGL